MADNGNNRIEILSPIPLLGPLPPVPANLPPHPPVPNAVPAPQPIPPPPPAPDAAAPDPQPGFYEVYEINGYKRPPGSCGVCQTEECGEFGIRWLADGEPLRPCKLLL